MMTTFSGKWGFDSNLIVYFLDETPPFYSRAKDLFSSIANGSLRAVIAPQNILETERVLTLVYKRPLVIVIQTMEQVIEEFAVEIIVPTQRTYQVYHDFLRSKGTPGDLHDIFLAATLVDNDVKRILTANVKDFSKIPEIEAVNLFR